MKTANFSSRIPNQIKSKDGEVHNLEKGITKALLEKYKSKFLLNIEKKSKKEFQKEVA